MSAVNKPLHKDLSFWIVAVTLVGAATATQLYFGIPWFADRLAQAQPAPRCLKMPSAQVTPVLGAQPPVKTSPDAISEGATMTKTN
ncbi:MAG TPA: hypothetical protein VF988_01530 [Verrucomicrobiae bacterium]